MFTDTPIEELAQILSASRKAFDQYRSLSISNRIALMRLIASEIEGLGSELIVAAMEETRLPEARLVGEKARTVFQWRSYADALQRGDALQVQINTANTELAPPKPDLRKSAVGIGPVAVFGASNFPFAFSTAGGDTASALAAGCSVIVKAHPGHPKTSAIMAGAIEAAVEKSGLPKSLFSHVYGASNATGTYLASHPLIKAVAFTGSYAGGKALFDIANARKEPIPVFAEMGSINPFFLLPGKLAEDPEKLAKQYVASLALGAGQFCTNPGLVIGLKGDALDAFVKATEEEIRLLAPMPMLHEGIAESYAKGCAHMLEQPNVQLLAGALPEGRGNASALVARVASSDFLDNPSLSHEVFGPFALFVIAEGEEDLTEIAAQLEGQLTITLSTTIGDARKYASLIEILKDKCGRLLYNGFPTGVEVCGAMQHGGPFPASTDSRFTSVGADAIKRFVKPMAYQNWPDELLPDELKDANPLKVWRCVNNEWTRDIIS